MYCTWTTLKCGGRGLHDDSSDTKWTTDQIDQELL